MNAQHDKTIPILSWLLAVWVTFVSVYGILTPDFYKQESVNWQVQSKGQDVFDLVVIPLLLIILSTYHSRRNFVARFLWAGVLLYLVYTFVIYSFAVHFNSLFIIYCVILGLSFFGFLYFLLNLQTSVSKIGEKAGIHRWVGWYFIGVAAAFYFLWLSEVIPASITSTVPKSLKDVGLLTNPVHALDLSVVLPGIFVTGILLLKENPLGRGVAAAFLTFFILMNLSIAWLNGYMHREGLVQDVTVAYGMIGLAIVNLVLLTKLAPTLSPSLNADRA